MSLIKIIDSECGVEKKPFKMENNANSNSNDIYELEHLRKLFIGGLTPSTTEESLKAYYEQWGPIVDCVVMRDPKTQRSRGFGFITYTQSDMVNKAQEARPHVVDGKEVEAKRALPRPDVGKPEINATVKKIFVGGLKDNHDEACLREYFSGFGNVIDIKIIIDKQTSRRRGFAYIEFDDYDAVDKAVLHKVHSIKYVVVDVKKSVYKKDQEKKAEASMVYGSQTSVHYGNQSYQTPNWQQPQNNYNNWNNATYGHSDGTVNKIFVGGLKDNHDDECLKEYFKQFGNVIDVKTIIDKQTGRRRGFAYVHFDDNKAVEKATAHKPHSIKHVIVEVKKFSYKSPDANKGSEIPVQPNTGGYNNNPGPIQNYSNQSYNQPPNWQYQQTNHWGNYSNPYQGGNSYGHPPSAAVAVPSTMPPNNYGPQSQIPANGSAQNNWGQQATSFNNNYQQGYNGGPMKHTNLGGNRMNPYGAQQPGGINQPPAPSHHGYNGGQLAAPVGGPPNYGPPSNYGPPNYGSSMNYGKQTSYNGTSAYGKQ